MLVMNLGVCNDYLDNGSKIYKEQKSGEGKQ